MELAPLLSPRSVAVVGASQKGGRATGAVRNLLDLGFAGGIFPVNPKYPTVLDLPCYPTLAAIPEPVDLVAIGIPGERVLDVLGEAHEKGVRAAVVFASGFGEAGEVGRRRQDELEAFAERTGMLVCGPNCLGVINLHDRAAGYSSTTPKDVAPGDVAVVSQSGTVIVALVRSRRGIGFSHLISSGNEVGVTSADYLRYLADDPRTKVLAAFMEGIKRPERFVAAAEAARKAGKPLVVVKTGRSELGGAASAAHTGSLAGSFAVQRALFRQKGVVHCEDLDEWIEAIEIFRCARAPTADGLGVIGVSGGENALVMDHAAEIGLDMPPLSDDGKRRLAELLPWYARPENPIDPTGGLADDPEMYRKCLEVLAAEPRIGVIAVSQDSPAVFDPLVARATAEVARSSDKCVVFFNNFSAPAPPEVMSTLREAGVPYLQGLRESLKAIKALLDFHRRAPDAAPIATARTSDERRAKARSHLTGKDRLLTENVAKSLLALYGFPVVPERLATSSAEAVEAADAFGYPVVAKVVSPDLAHKAASGGVRLGLNSADEVRGAFESIRDTIADREPRARVRGILIQPMVEGGIEVILGMKRDPQFGGTIVLGLGGVLVEAIREVSLRVAPISEIDARAMIEELPALHRILRKSAPSLAPESVLVPLLLRLSDLAVELGEDIEEIDMNPIILDPASGTATVVDALIVRRQGPEAAP